MPYHIRHSGRNWSVYSKHHHWTSHTHTRAGAVRILRAIMAHTHGK